VSGWLGELGSMRGDRGHEEGGMQEEVKNWDK